MGTMNEMQQEAMEHVNGPLLILAGAGSGKTRVITHRAAYLIKECGIDPYNIMAITFTNKAAGEMRERINQEVGFGAEGIWVSTFHSTCVRILRRYIDRLGYDTNFTIYDSDDQKSLMKDIIKRLQLDTKTYKERGLLSVISACKDELISPIEYVLEAAGNYDLKQKAKIYRIYQEDLKKNNALDFDDLIVKTVELFQDHQDVLRNYQERFKYIMVDEYQDTNTAQFQLIKLLAGKYENLCVVGDDDQSIYKFRGANIHNILDFEKTYPGAKVVKLEQNYRSTQNILSAANGVISHNVGRKGKALWTENEPGDRITFMQFDTAYEEAEYVAHIISTNIRNGGSYYDNAILYRTNAQSRILEEKLMISNIPYKIVGGVNFYARKEIKDMLCYLKTIDNTSDDLAVRRILNVPKRGIGATTVSRVQEFAFSKDMNFYDALEVADQIPNLGRGSAKLTPFITLMQDLRQKAQEGAVSDLLTDIIEQTGYVDELKAEGTDEAKSRIENIDELLNKIISYEEEEEHPTLNGFLQEVALVADIDNLSEDDNYVVLMTLHSAKGLEFDHVFLVGMEDGLFPSFLTITSDDKTEIEEERRLAYVGITRARKHLTLTSARQRMVRGETQFNAVSRFVKEIPSELIQGYIPKSRFEKEVESGTDFSNSGSSFGRSSVNKNFVKKPYENPYKNKDFGIKDSSQLGYTVGDTVRHMKFGQGSVTDIVSGGRDFEVTVDFEQVGTKKMFASFAKLKKV